MDNLLSVGHCLATIVPAGEVGMDDRSQSRLTKIEGVMGQQKLMVARR